MAKLNWQKVAADKKYKQSQANYFTDKSQANKNYFMIGKHKGTHIRHIPTNYLIWASESLPERDIHKGLADKELVRRYNKIST